MVVLVVDTAVATRMVVLRCFLPIFEAIAWAGVILMLLVAKHPRPAISGRPMGEPLQFFPTLPRFSL